MKKPFIDALNERVLLADGAMGTEIYARGFYVNRCYDELNLINPEIIRDIHEKYAEAGAEILTTNTYGANRPHLQSFGLDDRLGEINRRGVELAREIAGDDCYVAASIGPLTSQFHLPHDAAMVRQHFKEQAQALLDAGPDCILLETFSNLEQLELAYLSIRELDPAFPVIPSASIRIFTGPVRISPTHYVRTIRRWGARLLGINCGGPPESMELLPELFDEAGCDFKVSIMPSAGFPKIVEGRTLYLASPEYMAEYTRRFIQQGVSIVGGCCGTTPAMIKEMKSFLRSVQPGMSVSVIHEPKEEDEGRLPPIPREERTLFGKILGTKFAVSVELDPPEGSAWNAPSKEPNSFTSTASTR